MTYAGKGAVKVMNVHVVKNHFDDHIVGCKITIPEGQKGVVENNAFWPKGIQCRDWGKKIKQDRVGEKGTYKTIVDSSRYLWTMMYIRVQICIKEAVGKIAEILIVITGGMMDMTMIENYFIKTTNLDTSKINKQYMIMAFLV